MSKVAIAIIIASSVATFRRAGHGFTDNGTAFPSDYFTDDQLKAIHAEKRLSVKEVSIDAIPDGVDRSPLDLALQLARDAQSQEEGKKAPAAKAPPAPDKKPATKKPAAKNVTDSQDGNKTGKAAEQVTK
ncbi:HI1506-related protein [Neptunicella sp. SCSIO 80796]|uniref:HI1506-related protein n=1 Tax=Neptunicella plasticusilytica TaxID=3117012 RepID=UPI003A4DECE4